MASGGGRVTRSSSAHSGRPIRPKRVSAELARQRLSFPADDSDSGSAAAGSGVIPADHRLDDAAYSSRSRSHLGSAGLRSGRGMKKRRLNAQQSSAHTVRSLRRSTRQSLMHETFAPSPPLSRQSNRSSPDVLPRARTPEQSSLHQANKENDSPEQDKPRYETRRASLRRRSVKISGIESNYDAILEQDNEPHDADAIEPDESIHDDDVDEQDPDEEQAEDEEDHDAAEDDDNEVNEDNDAPRYSLRRRVRKQERSTPLSSLHSMRYTRNRSSRSTDFGEMSRLRMEQSKERARLERALRRARRAGEPVDRNGRPNSDDDAPRRSARTRTITQRFAPAPSSALGHSDDIIVAGRRRVHSKDRRDRRRRRSAAGSGSLAVLGASDLSSDGSSLSDRERRSSRHRHRPGRASEFGSMHALDALDLEDGTGDNADGRRRRKSTLADIDPIQVDPSVKFDSVGGLDRHIESLKEMVVLPLLYPELFQRFRITAPRGVLFFGPPGTGKTLTARALANSCSDNGQKVTFFMRKGADCLSKWVGEAERQLRLLFKQAYLQRPSIIFFDEIDGLAPVRSSRQDQIHSSIVSTLLALMDGLDDRGQVIVIGATNRIDSIDPALRRPGRFDRELCFSLPSKSARRAILSVHTAKWQPPLETNFRNDVADRCVGYCGADIKALCTEASLRAIRRRFPEIYSSTQKLVIDPDSVNVEPEDFLLALKTLVPASHRSSNASGHSLPRHLDALLRPQLDHALSVISGLFPLSAVTPSARAQGSQLDVNGPIPIRPRVLVTGPAGCGHTLICTAILDHLEEHAMYAIDLATLMADAVSRSPEEAMVRAVAEARRNAPSILYWPHCQLWWSTASAGMRATLTTLLHDLPSSAPVLLLASAEHSIDELDDDLALLFGAELCSRIPLRLPVLQERRSFFELLKEAVLAPLPAVMTLKKLPSAPAVSIPVTLSQQKDLLSEEDEQKALRSLRIFLRALCTRLLSEFKVFAYPVDEHREPGYYSIIQEPLCIDEIRHRCNNMEILCIRDFLADIDRIVGNVRKYFCDESSISRSYINKACQLQDFAIARVGTFNSSTAKLCEEIAQRRRVANSSDRAVAADDVPKTSITDANSSVDASAVLSSDAPVTTAGDQTHQDNSAAAPDGLDIAVDISQPPLSADEEKPQQDLDKDTNLQSFASVEPIQQTDVLLHSDEAEEEVSPLSEAGPVDASDPVTSQVLDEQHQEQTDMDRMCIIDQDKLNQVLQLASETCDNCTIDELEMRHLSMFKIAYQYRNVRQRDDLVVDLLHLAMNWA